MSQESYPPGCHTVPTSTNMSPTTGADDEDDLTVTLTGAGFWEGTQIVFGGVRMPTTWNGSNQVSTSVDLTGRAAGTIPVRIRNGNRRFASTTRNFTVTEAE